MKTFWETELQLFILWGGIHFCGSNEEQTGVLRNRNNKSFDIWLMRDDICMCEPLPHYSHKICVVKMCHSLTVPRDLNLKRIYASVSQIPLKNRNMCLFLTKVCVYVMFLRVFIITLPTNKHNPAFLWKEIDSFMQTNVVFVAIIVYFSWVVFNILSKIQLWPPWSGSAAFTFCIVVRFIAVQTDLDVG